MDWKNLSSVWDVRCPGCRETEGRRPVVPETCTVYPCARARGIKFCCDCPDFPCGALHPYAERARNLPHNTKVYNLCLMKRIGVMAWEESKARDVKRTYFTGK